MSLVIIGDMTTDITNYFRIKPKETVKHLDVNSNKQELANKDRDANLRCVNDPGETKRAVRGSQNPAIMHISLRKMDWDSEDSQ